MKVGKENAIKIINRLWGTASLAVGLCAAVPAHSTLVVTADGAALGFSASTVISGFPNTSPGSFGPFGLTVFGTNILVSNSANSTRYVFSDVDNQTVADSLFSASSGSGVQGYASVGGIAYGGNGGNFVQFNADGTVNRTIAAGASPSLGIAGNAVSGNLIATSSRGLIEIDPVADSFRVINGVSGDGVSVSPDGLTAFVEVSSDIRGYNIATGAQVFNSGFLSGGPDGTGVISSTNSLNGFIVVNYNNGNVGLIDPATSIQTIIAQNAGQRGDYAAPDFNNGTLLLDFSTEISRLSCGQGCSIGAPPPPGPGGTVPEPGTLSLISLAIAGLAWRRRSSHTGAKSTE